MSLLGIHIDSTPNSLLDQIDYYAKKKCRILQLFVSLNKSAKDFYIPIKDVCKKNNISLSVHISYLINIAVDPYKYSWTMRKFIDEIKLAHHIGAFCVVVHLGKQLDLTRETALNNMYINLLKVHNETKHLDIKILIETSTGQGSEMCYNLDDLASFYNKISKIERFGICVDTCHIFNAGYDIRTKKEVETYFKEFNQKIGIKKIKLIHLNDSQNKLGDKIDRHANIGHGEIGEEGIKEIIHFFTRLEVPLVLETPDEYINEDLEKIINYAKSYITL